MLATRVAGVEGQVGGLREDIDRKHKENRASIHDLRNNDQHIMDALHAVKVQIAKMTGYCVGAVGAATFLAKILDRLWR